MPPTHSDPSIALAPEQTASAPQLTDVAPIPSAKPAKATPRRRAREFALQGLYQWLLAGQDLAAVLASIHELEAFHKADKNFCLQLVRCVIAQQQTLKSQLTPFIDREFSELSAIEACILLMGTYELTQTPETPYRVIINEYIELTKIFGGAEGHKYVNGVLDKVALQVRPTEQHNLK